MSHPSELDVEVPGLEANFVAGGWRPATGVLTPVVSPTTEEVIAHAAAPTREDADAAVAAARAAFDRGPWPRMPLAERLRVCERLCDALEARLPQLNRAWTFESGPTLAHGEMINDGAGVAIWRQALELAPTLPWEEERQGAQVWREPVGTVLGILTFNGPRKV